MLWRTPIGFFDDLKVQGLGNTGAPNIGGSIVTAFGLILIGATIDRRFRAFDLRNGRLLWEAELDASATPRR